MDQRLLNWLINNVGRIFPSPRTDVFDQKAYALKIIGINEKQEKVEFHFVGGKSKGLPLFFWMFERTLNYIRANEKRFVRLGAKVQRPFDDNTVEGQIWKEPHPYRTPFKASPHICDFLVLSGLANYGFAENPKTSRSVQGIKYTARVVKPPEAPYIEPPGKDDEKADFIRKYKQAIIEWTERNENKIVCGRLSYSWGNKPTSECVRKRNELSKAIITSRIKNNGGVDLNTLDKVIMWGFKRKFPLRNTEEALKITQKAFSYLDDGNLKKATRTLLSIPNVGISRASKILGLYDQDNLCIYDSRVATVLKDLKLENKRIVLCPPGYGRPGDQVPTDDDWAENYQRLIWTVEIIRDYLNERRHTYRLADVEMALFMIGK